MTAIWGLHNDHPDLDLVTNKFVSVRLRRTRRLTTVGADKEADEGQGRGRGYPNAKTGRHSRVGRLLLRFAFEMKVGDLVIYPYKPDSTLNFGRIEGDYYHDPSAALHREPPQGRPGCKTGVPRAQFSKSARYEVGSAVTLFRVKNHAQEFAAFVDGAAPTGHDGSATTMPHIASQPTRPPPTPRMSPMPSASRSYTRDFSSRPC